jgi:hypothetical protein
VGFFLFLNMAIIRTASNVNDRLPRDAALDETIIKCYNVIVARDSLAEQWSLLRKFALGAQALETNIFPDSRVRDMYWELWNELAPNYHNDGCKSNLYQPLGKYKIRLVSLIKHDGDKLVCRLDRYPQWLAPEYDALSYAWGNSTDTTTIICNGIELSISTALHVALRHLLEGAVRSLRPLWIDAICLNQQDDDEKAHLVPCMGNIYKLATRTLIWLGEAADESDKAMEFLRDLDQKTKVREHTRYTGREDYLGRFNSLQTNQNDRRVMKSVVALLRRSWFSRLWKRKRQTDQISRQIMESVVALLQRSWFSRLWTMQEVVFSQNPQMVCGGKSLGWSAIQTFRDTVQKLQFRPLRSRPGIGLFSWNEIIKIVLLPLALEGLRLEVRRGRDCDVGALLVLSEWKDCKEAVDRIWAISALFSERLQQRVREADIIDYSASGRHEYWKSYLNFMKMLYLEHPQQLWDVIYFGTGLTKNPNLPSWCPDFNATRKYHKYLYTEEGCRAGFPDANSSITPTLLLSSESALLTVKGFTFETVQSVTQNILQAFTLLEEAIEDEKKALRDWLQEAFRLVRETFGVSREAVVRLCQTLLPLKQAYLLMSTEAWQQVEFVLSVTVAYLYEAGVFGLSDLGDEVPESIRSEYDEAVKNITTEIIEDGGPLRFLGRTFITTTHGGIGIGTADMRSGDMICIIEGAEAVFVLRSVHDTVLSSGIYSQEDLDQHQELFRHVGDVYIHGCMCGEAFTTPERGPDRQFVLV